jgi:hypothetical protein
MFSNKNKEEKQRDEIKRFIDIVLYLIQFNEETLTYENTDNEFYCEVTVGLNESRTYEIRIKGQRSFFYNQANELETELPNYLEKRRISKEYESKFKEFGPHTKLDRE